MTSLVRIRIGVEAQSKGRVFGVSAPINSQSLFQFRDMEVEELGAPQLESFLLAWAEETAYIFRGTAPVDLGHSAP
jgi:hypothetical protein